MLVVCYKDLYNRSFMRIGREDKMIRKGLAFLAIILFLGLAFAPTILGTTVYNNSLQLPMPNFRVTEIFWQRWSMYDSSVAFKFKNVGNAPYDGTIEFYGKIRTIYGRIIKERGSYLMTGTWEPGEKSTINQFMSLNSGLPSSRPRIYWICISIEPEEDELNRFNNRMCRPFIIFDRFMLPLRQRRFLYWFPM